VSQPIIIFVRGTVQDTI